MKSATLLIAAALCLAVTAAAAGPAAVAPAAFTFRLGAFELVALRDARFQIANDGKTFGVDVGPAAVAKVLSAAGAPTDEISVDVDALLVKTPGRTVLLDTGLGPGAHGALKASLARAGVAPTAITDVLITHSHGDHVGGLLTADGALAFPNATIRMSAREWAFLRGSRANAQLAAAIAPRVKTFEPGAVVVPGVTAVGLEGHTPGHSGYQIVSASQQLLDFGDIAHSSIISLARPAWIIEFDQNPAAGKASRIATLTQLARSHELVFSPHFPFPGIGRIRAAAEGYVWEPVRP